jgi:signal transduction histidine kinase
VTEGKSSGDDRTQVTSVLKCWEHRACRLIDCPAYGATDAKCWIVSRDFEPALCDSGDKFAERCAGCDVFTAHMERALGRRLSDTTVADTVKFLAAEVGCYQVALEKAYQNLRAEHAALEGKFHQSSMLFKICNVMHGTIELETILKIILTSVTSGNALGFNRAIILLVDEENGTLEGRLGIGPSSMEEAGRIWSDLEASGATFEHVVKMSTETTRSKDEPLTRTALSLAFPLTPGVDVTVQSVLEKKPFHVRDVRSFDGPLSQSLTRVFGRSEFVVVPISAKGRALGALVADNEFSRKPITEDEVDLLSSLGHQAGLALENARVYESLKLHFSEVSTLQEVGKGILSTTNLADVLELIARISAQVIGATGSILWLYDEDTGQVIPRASFGKGTSIVERKLKNLGEELARWTLAEKAPVLVPDTSTDARFGDDERTVASSIIAVPLTALDATVGVITVYDKMARSDFDSNVFEKGDEQFLAILADQAAIAVHNARLFDAFKEAEKRLRETQALLLRTEKLAAVGEMSSKMAHEIRNPLTSIGGFARRVSKSLKANDQNKDYLEIIVRETERLERILNEQLQFAQLSRPRLKMEDLNSVVEQSLVLVSEEALRRKAKILKRLSLELPKLLLDSDKMKQVLINILQNALKFLPVGGKIKVETKRAGDYAHVIIGNEGERIPGELMDRLFVPFFTSGKEGTGLGLAVAYQIVKEHGGEIRVKSDDEWSTVFCVCLPVSTNQDRRRSPGDRRRLTDRRKLAAEDF